MQNNKLVDLLHIKYPIIQAPMAGGITTTDLVTAVAIEGGLGMVGAGYMNPGDLQDQLLEIKLITNNFGVNLFVPQSFTYTEEEFEIANRVLSTIRKKMGINQIPHLPTVETILKKFEEQLDIVLAANVSVCSFTFGLPSKAIIKKLKGNGTTLIGTATTVKEAIEVEKAGMDAVVVQGSEAGGHRGAFLNEYPESSIGLMALVPQVVDKVKIPVIAAGGIMDGRGLAASLSLGAKGVQMGTAFLTTDESGANPLHKQAILRATVEDIVETKLYSGKRAQGIHNKFIADMKEQEEMIPAFPIMNTLTSPIRNVAAANKDTDYMSLWSGQSPTLAKKQSVKDLMESIVTEANKLIN